MDKVYSSYQHQSSVFQPERLKHYHFRLFLREDMAQYVVLNEKGKIAAVKEYRSKVPMDFTEFFDAFMSQDYFVREQYASVEVMYGVPEFSLIPKSHFDPSRMKAFASATLKSDLGTDDLLHRDLPSVGASAIFSIPFAVKQKCDHYLQNPAYLPLCNPAVNMALQLSADTPDLLLINIFGNQFILTAIKGGKLHLCNAYSFASVTDIVYFVQLVLDVVKADVGRTEIFISGEFERESELMRQMLKYIPHMGIPERPLSAQFATQSDKLPHWRYAFLSF